MLSLFLFCCERDEFLRGLARRLSLIEWFLLLYLRRELSLVLCLRSFYGSTSIVVGSSFMLSWGGEGSSRIYCELSSADYYLTLENSYWSYVSLFFPVGCYLKASLSLVSSVLMREGAIGLFPALSLCLGNECGLELAALLSSFLASKLNSLTRVSVCLAYW